MECGYEKLIPRTIVLSKITAIQAGLKLTTKDLESHYLAGGRVPNVVRALIAANRANIELSFQTATAIDLAGRDILEAVQTSVNPKVIDCPDPKKGKETVDAVAQDGIQLKAKARVTVRANIQRLIGGATEETVIARVGEGIVTTIGSSITYKGVLENPDESQSLCSPRDSMLELHSRFSRLISRMSMSVTMSVPSCRPHRLKLI